MNIQQLEECILVSVEIFVDLVNILTHVLGPMASSKWYSNW